VQQEVVLAMLAKEPSHGSQIRARLRAALGPVGDADPLQPSGTETEGGSCNAILESQPARHAWLAIVTFSRRQEGVQRGRAIPPRSGR
jgi:hypothetical protein